MSSRSLIALLLAGPIVAGTMLLGGCDKQSAPAGQANSASPASAPTSGEMPDEAPSANATPPADTTTVQVDRSHKGESAPTTGFADPAGKPVTLADFKGKPVLLNLWATWCGPCIAEMPTLDALAGQQAGKVTVLTVSQDLDGTAKVLPFFKDHGFKALKTYTDPDAALSIRYKANLPTTILYDSSGHELWRVTGGMDWTGADASRLIAEAK